MFPSKSFLVLRWMIASRCSRPKRITKISCIAMCFGVYDFTISILNRESTPPRPLPRNYPINGIVRSTIGPRANYWFDFSTSWTSRERERERQVPLSPGRPLEGPGIWKTQTFLSTHTVQPNRGNFVETLLNLAIQVRGEKSTRNPVIRENTIPSLSLSLSFFLRFFPSSWAATKNAARRDRSFQQVDFSN